MTTSADISLARAIVLGLPRGDLPDPQTGWYLAGGEPGQTRLIAASLTQLAHIAETRRKANDAITVMAVAPAEATTLHLADFPDLAAKQAQAAGRLLALENSMGPADDQHAVAGLPREGDGNFPVIVVDKARMGGWLAWAAGKGFDPDIVMPAALLVSPPMPEDGGFVGGTVLGERLLRSDASALVDEPALVAAIVSDAPVVQLDGAIVDAAIAQASETPLINLRSGPFRKRTGRGFSAAAVRRLVLVIAGIAFASLAMALILLFKYWSATSAMDADTVARARSVVRDVSTAQAADGALDQRLRVIGGGPNALTAPLSGLYQALQAQPAVSFSNLNYRADGTLTANLAAPRVDDLNAVLLAVQARGFKVTAIPRTGADGRQAAEITIRASQ